LKGENFQSLRRFSTLAQFRDQLLKLIPNLSVSYLLDPGFGRDLSFIYASHTHTRAHIYIYIYIYIYLYIHMYTLCARACWCKYARE
jgi:hypothetical protein